MQQKVMITALLGASLSIAQTVEEKKIEIRMAAPIGGTQGDVLIHAGPGMPGMPGPTVEFLSHEMAGPLRTVTGAPYAADIISESTQTLADGNRIVNKHTSAFFRDSEGRTRREVMIELPQRPQDSHKLIMIDDPVAGVHYVLNTKDKTARKLALPRQGDLRFFTAPAPPPPGALPGGAGPNVLFHQVEIRKGPAGAAAAVPESLGKQTMEGVEVSGTRTSVRIPAGQIGNEREIVATTESWFSDELKTTILSRRTDPRFGDSTSRTVNLRRGEQARYLFEVPADFKVEDKPAGGVRIERKL